MSEQKTLDLNTAKIKQVQNLVIPFRKFGINLSAVADYNTDLIRLLNSEDQLIGYGVLEKIAGELCLNLNVDYGTPERLNIDNGEFYLDFNPQIQLTMSMKCGSTGTELDTLTVQDLHIPSIRILTTGQRENEALQGGFGEGGW